MNVSNIPMFVGGVTLVAVSTGAIVYQLKKGAKIDNSKEKLEIPLVRVSRLWKDDLILAGNTDTLPVASREAPLFHKGPISEFYRTVLAPYVETALYSGVLGPSLNVIIQVLFLLDKEGDCPSIVEVFGDPEYDQYSNYYDILKSVSLYEHSLHVAEEAVKIINTTGQYREPQFLLGKVLIVALAHDLGKIERYRHGPSYILANHPAISRAVIEPLLTEIPNREEILKAVGDHHQAGSTDPLVSIIRESDRRARERELASSSGRVLVSQDEFSWLDAGELMREIDTAVNIAQEDGFFGAFTAGRDGFVYVAPSLISSLTRKLAVAKGISLVDASNDKNLSIKIVHTRLKGFLAAEIGEGFSARKCSVKSKGTAKEKMMFLAPMRADAFPTPIEELEKRKEDPGFTKEKEIEYVKIIGVGTTEGKTA